jgi:hypothetical protein
MMDELIRLGEGLRVGLQERLRNFFEPNRVQGALVEVDRYWYEWASWQRAPHHMALSPPSVVLVRYAGRAVRLYELFEKQLPWDLNAKPPDWTLHAHSMGYGEDASPVVVRVILRTSDKPLREFTSEGLPRSYNGHPLLYEERPPAVAVGKLGDLLAGLLPTRKPSVCLGE